LVNMDADGLSRNPIPSQADATGARWHVEEGEDSLPGWHCSTFLCLLAMNGDTTGEATVATVDADDGEESGGAKDIFEDVDVMKYLKDGEVKVTWSTKERDRVLQRAKRFVWERTHLLRLWPDGTKKVVPAPEERVKLIKHAHEDLGHFGVRRTYSLLQIHYWWRGMQQQVQAMVARCVVCDRVRASFNAPMPQLQPLPIMGLGYRWSLDFVGPLPVTPRHNKYVLVMIEHFSKWIELVALPDKFNEGAAYSFLDRVLSRFGALAELLTDQGREFLGEFQTLCEQAMIDHHTTSRDHPEADGLAERMVQTVERGLRKYSLNKGHHGDWDLQLPWIDMGYRFSKQASLASFSPYYLLFGRHPVLPKAIQADADTVLANMTTGRIILRVREVLGSGVLLLEGRDGKFWKDHTRNCTPCHLPHIDGTIHPGTAHISAGLKCRLCGSPKRAATMVICDVCSTWWHLECLTPPLLEVPVG
jgi:hypothetical protein